MKNLIKKLGTGIALAGISISGLGCGNTYLFSKSEFDYSEKKGLSRTPPDPLKNEYSVWTHYARDSTGLTRP